MLSPSFALLLSGALRGVFAAVVNLPLSERDISLVRRATTNGSCISAPDDSCVSLVGLCVAGISSGRVPSTQFWSDNTCTAAATCAGMGSVLDAACCAGTCHQPTDIVSLDYNTVYTSMVGASCAAQAGGCPLTWQSFVDWFYNTIQATNTNLWPESGDVVLDWWASIATWTAFCEGTNCVDSAIPYTNFNDWFHFSSDVSVTTPGTPQYVEPLDDDLSDNDDDWTPDFGWPCSFDDPDDCWWDYGPETTATSAKKRHNGETSSNAPRGIPVSGFTKAMGKLSLVPAGNLTGLRIDAPANVPPPTYVLGQPLVLHLNGTQYTPPSSSPNARSITGRYTVPPTEEREPPVELEVPTLERRAIVPDACTGPTESLSTLPVLSYYCNLLPNICDNIRSHPDWPGGATMTLTYDPFGAKVGTRRKGVCTTAVKRAMQAAGKCDWKEHNPAYWKVSCDEFPFNASLEGGVNNAQVMAVPTREQQYQGTLQSSITNLISNINDRTTVWKGAKNKKCHRYVIQLLNGPEAGAPASAVGSLNTGSAYLNNFGQGLKFVTDSRVTALTHPNPFATNTAYPSYARKLKVPGNSKVFDCRPCTLGAPPPGPPIPPDADIAVTGNGTVVTAQDWNDSAQLGDADDGAFDELVSDFEDLDLTESEDNSVEPDITTTKVPLTPTAPPTRRTIANAHEKRQDSCTVDSTTALATSTPQALSVASNAAVAVATAVAAASSASAAASASNAAPTAIAAAAAAMAAANALPPAAAAIAAATDDTTFAAAIVNAVAAVEAAQDAVSVIWSLPDIPDDINEVANQVITASSSVSDVMQNVQNVIPATTPIAADTDPETNPLVVTGPPPGIPAAACFGAGSQGKVLLNPGNTYIQDSNGNPVIGQLVDAGSDAFFALDITNTFKLTTVDGVGCSGVYGWAFGVAPSFQVDCSTNELGSYWNGVEQTCYTYLVGTETYILCGNNLGTMYSCLQNGGEYGNLNPVTITWIPS